MLFHFLVGQGREVFCLTETLLSFDLNPKTVKLTKAITVHTRHAQEHTSVSMSYSAKLDQVHVGVPEGFQFSHG